ncbi:hypothetical protein HA466_0108170 [Hirschfeldia incana]|nr:hypothetical protein HA466_0108170 [Hirschfeldia incana]
MCEQGLWMSQNSLSFVPLCLNRWLCWLLLCLWVIFIWFRSVFRLIILAFGGEEGKKIGLGGLVLGWDSLTTMVLPASVLLSLNVESRNVKFVFSFSYIIDF